MTKNKDIPEVTIKDGIAYFKTPYKVNGIQFAFEHLDCLSVVVETEDCSDDYETVVCYSTDKIYNKNLKKVYMRNYKNKGFEMFRHTSASEVNCID